jgi:hypothetical protein
MKSALDYFLELDGGDNWQDLVECWVKFERLLEYPDRDVSGTVTIRFENWSSWYMQNRAHWLNAKGRPEEVKFWNGRGKKLTIIPEFKVSEFAAVWQSWWQSLQPSWHIQDGLLLSNAVPADEEWSSLCRGAN